MEKFRPEFNESEVLEQQIRSKLDQVRTMAAPFVLPISDFNNTQVRKFLSEIQNALKGLPYFEEVPGFIRDTENENAKIAQLFSSRRFLWVFKDMLMKRGKLDLSDKNFLETYNNNREKVKGLKSLHANTLLAVRNELSALKQLAKRYLQERRLDDEGEDEFEIDLPPESEV